MITIKESNLPDWQDTIVDEVYNVLKNNRIYAEVYDDYDFSGNDNSFVLCVEINDGDWKHEHRTADNVIVNLLDNYDNIEVTNLGEDITNEDGSDTYSSIHKFHILRYPDDNGFDFDDIEQLDIKFPKRESIKRVDNIKKALKMAEVGTKKINESCKENIHSNDYTEKLTFANNIAEWVFDGSAEDIDANLEELENLIGTLDMEDYESPESLADRLMSCDLDTLIFLDSELNINDFEESCNLKEDNDKAYGRYMVKFTPYKNMFKFDYIDNYFDRSDYCFFNNNGYVNTDYSGITKNLFDKLYDKDMKPNKVYEIYTNTPHGEVLYYEEVPSHWFK